MFPFGLCDVDWLAIRRTVICERREEMVGNGRRKLWVCWMIGGVLQVKLQQII